jgi:hypothetical protein
VSYRQTNQFLNEGRNVPLKPGDRKRRACRGTDQLIGIAQLLVGLVNRREAVPTWLEQVLQVGILRVTRREHVMSSTRPSSYCACVPKATKWRQGYLKIGGVGKGWVLLVVLGRMQQHRRPAVVLHHEGLHLCRPTC